MIRQKILSFTLMALGGAAALIGSMMFAFGPQTTGNVFAAIFQHLVEMPPTVDGFGDANTDSELRFYSVLWIAYGLIAIQTSRVLREKMTRARLLMFVFFMGGIARLFSIAQFGMPHPLFVVLMSVELGLPVIWFLLSLKRIKI